ncbi:hypothetical protein Hte_003087 [Hypoxylon texense]
MLSIIPALREIYRALIAGAFDDRIALALPQEGESGGPGCWRIVVDIKKNGTKREDATQIITGDSWFATVYESLGAKDALGVSQASHGPSHCSMPSTQNPEVAAFFNKFLLGQAYVAADVVKTDGKSAWFAGQWIDWVTTTLS